MKKYKIYLVVVIILMIIPIIYKITIKHHNVEYKVGNYKIQEIFQINNKVHTYEFYIMKGKEAYSYRIENKINKRKKIIKEIKVYKKNDVKCILPIYINAKEHELYCRKGNIQVSKEFLKEDLNYQEIIKKVEKYIEKNNTEKKSPTNYNNMKVYNSNIPKNNSLIIWNYKGIYILSNKDNKYQQFLDYDIYDKIEATTTSKYFVLLENTSVKGIEKIHCYDLVKGKYKVIQLEEWLSKDSYINGAVGDLVYITDKKKKKEYTLNIKKEQIKEVGNEDEDYIKYVDKKPILLSKSEFFIENQYFQNERTKDTNVTTAEDLVKDNNIYYFKEENTFYRQFENKNRVVLFEEDNIDEWNVINNKILFRIEDKLYLYDEKNNLNKILEYSELKYNYKNTYYIWK